MDRIDHHLDKKVLSTESCPPSSCALRCLVPIREPGANHSQPKLPFDLCFFFLSTGKKSRREAVCGCDLGWDVKYISTLATGDCTWENVFSLIWRTSAYISIQPCPWGDGQDGTSWLGCHIYIALAIQQIAVEILYSAPHAWPQPKYPFSPDHRGEGDGWDGMSLPRWYKNMKTNFWWGIKCSSPKGHRTIIELSSVEVDPKHGKKGWGARPHRKRINICHSSSFGWIHPLNEHLGVLWSSLSLFLSLSIAPLSLSPLLSLGNQIHHHNFRFSLFSFTNSQQTLKETQKYFWWEWQWLWSFFSNFLFPAQVHLNVYLSVLLNKWQVLSFQSTALSGLLLNGMNLKCPNARCQATLTWQHLQPTPTHWHQSSSFHQNNGVFGFFPYSCPQKVGSSNLTQSTQSKFSGQIQLKFSLFHTCSSFLFSQFGAWHSANFLLPCTVALLGAITKRNTGTQRDKGNQPHQCLLSMVIPSITMVVQSSGIILWQTEYVVLINFFRLSSVQLDQDFFWQRRGLIVHNSADMWFSKHRVSETKNKCIFKMNTKQISMEAAY